MWTMQCSDPEVSYRLLEYSGHLGKTQWEAIIDANDGEWSPLYFRHGLKNEAERGRLFSGLSPTNVTERFCVPRRED